MSETRLTAAQEHALMCLQASRGHGYDPHGVATVSATGLFDGQAWVHWQTMDALERRGLVRVEREWGEGCDIWLTEAGYPQEAT